MWDLDTINKMNSEPDALGLGLVRRLAGLVNKPGNIFVFGSNLAGRHGKGAALHARLYWGAETGCGVGPMGQSYAIPTKDSKLVPLGLLVIRGFVTGFVAYANEHPEQKYWLTRVGCGLAGYADSDIAPMFSAAPDNVLFPKEWAPWRYA